MSDDGNDSLRATQIRWEDHHGLPQGAVVWGGEHEDNALKAARAAGGSVRYRALDENAQPISAWLVLHPCPFCQGTGWYQAVTPERAHMIYPRKVYTCTPCDGSGLDPDFHKVELSVEPDTDDDDDESWVDM